MGKPMATATISDSTYVHGVSQYLSIRRQQIADEELIVMALTILCKVVSLDHDSLLMAEKVRCG